MTTRIVFLDRGTLPPATRLRAPAFPHELVAHERTAPAEVAGRLRDAAIAITNKVPVGAEAMDASPGLRLIAVAATGTDVIDLAAARARGIAVVNIRGYATATVPEHTFALILALSRSVVPYGEAVRRGRWLEAGQFCFFDHPIRDLAGAALAVVGGGALGAAVARIGAAFGMEVLLAERRGAPEARSGRVPFEAALRRADVVTLHAPLTPETRGLFGDAEFALMERRPLFVNTARGGLVDEPALVRAVLEGQVSGAGLDVASVEPLPADHPFQALLGRPDVIVTPHVAWAGAGAAQALADQLVDLLEAFVAGRPRHLL